MIITTGFEMDMSRTHAPMLVAPEAYRRLRPQTWRVSILGAPGTEPAHGLASGALPVVALIPMFCRCCKPIPTQTITSSLEPTSSISKGLFLLRQHQPD